MKKCCSDAAWCLPGYYQFYRHDKLYEAIAECIDVVTDESVLLPSDDIMQQDNGPLCAAVIDSELQKQFAILPGLFL